MNKCICDFCKKEIIENTPNYPKFKIRRCDTFYIGYDSTGFDKLDICMDCLKKLKEGSADNE